MNMIDGFNFQYYWDHKKYALLHQIHIYIGDQVSAATSRNLFSKYVGGKS